MTAAKSRCAGNGRAVRSSRRAGSDRRPVPGIADGRAAPRRRYGSTNPGKNRGFSRTASGTGNGNPTTTARPVTWFCAVQPAVPIFAAGAISAAPSPITWPIRPPLATLHCETPPQWLTDPGWKGFGMLLEQSVTIRVAACGLSRPTNLAERSLAKVTRAVTVTVPSGVAPLQATSVQSRRPKVAESTVNTTYLPFTRILLPTGPAGTVAFWLPEIPSTENPPPSHPADEAANAARGVEKNDNAPHAPAATTYPSIRLLIRASRVSPTRVRQRRAGRRGNFLRDDGHASVRPRRGPRSAQRAVHDPDGGHHAFVLVLEDVAVEYEAAELRSVELDHHQHAGPRRQRIVVVQHVPVDRRGQPSAAESIWGGRPPARRRIPPQEHGPCLWGGG